MINETKLETHTQNQQNVAEFLKPETDDFASQIQSMLSEVRNKKKASAAAANAKPAEPIENNPWIIQGLRLVQSKSTCLHCGTVSDISHGLVEVYKHKKTSAIWETALVHTSAEHFPTIPYLGTQTIGDNVVNGCLDCIGTLFTKESAHE